MSNMLPKVNVLLSSYNGEKYLQQQLESLTDQTYENISVWVRDDGSNDGTAEILRKWESQPEVHVAYGKNIGFVDSFFSLLLDCGEADCYAFCDQDDVWEPEKIARAVEMLSSVSPQKPALWFCHYDCYDEDMHFQSHSAPPRRLSFEGSLMDCVPLGFTMVINRKARDEIVEKLPKHSCGHDWWAFLVCAGLGEVIFDERTGVKYRRHGNAASFGGKGFFAFQVWRFKKFFRDQYFVRISEQLREFERQYGNRLSEENRKLLQGFTRKTGVERWGKVFYPGRFRQKVSDEILLRVCFLLGKL